MTHTGMAGVN